MRPPLFIALDSEPWRRFQAGTKRVELRRDAPRWRDRNVFPGRPITLSRGYSTRDRLSGVVVAVHRAARLAELPPGILQGADLRGATSRYFDPDAPVVAIVVALDGDTFSPLAESALGRIDPAIPHLMD